MDLGFLTEYCVPVILAACLVVGYCIKHTQLAGQDQQSVYPGYYGRAGAGAEYPSDAECR